MSKELNRIAARISSEVLMDKTRLGAGSYLLPMPVVLAGANVNDRPNFLTIAYVGIVSHTPAMIEIALRKDRFSSSGIKKNQTFSVNAATAALVDAIDFCGIYSGEKVDKSGIFEVFYGELKTAPMIAESPLNLECRLAEVLDLGGSHEVFIGEIVEAYSTEEYLSNGRPDLQKIQPIVYDGSSTSYWTLENKLARAFQVGKDYRP
jgi:flavin reductase (DIM6/NTAB) family NADH-FMN oxidoreductase RutF